MTDSNGFAPSGTKGLPLYCVERTGFDAWRQLQVPEIGSWIDAHSFTGVSGSVLLLPGDGGIAGAVLGVGDPLDPYSYAHAPFALPPGDWALASELDPDALRALHLGWGLGAYRFTRY
jgi:leucyl aminopeptidase